LRLTRSEKLWELARQINAGVFEGEAVVHKADLMEMLPKIRADVAYFDPPYPGVMSYEREYKVIDEILEGSAKPTSPFTAKDGASMLDVVFERAMHIPIWILSLGNAVVGIEELEAKMTRLGKTTRSIAIKYQHLPAIATEEKKESNREFLVIGWDPDAALLRHQSGEQTRVEGTVSDGELPDVISGVEDDAAGCGSQLPTSQSSLSDPREQREPSLTEQAAASRWSAVPVPERGMDDPDAVGPQTGFDLGGERRV